MTTITSGSKNSNNELLKEYKKLVDENYTKVRIFDIDSLHEKTYVQIEDIFVDLECVPYKKPGTKILENDFNKSKCSCKSLVVSSNNRKTVCVGENLCILGLPGAGKTTLLKYLVHEYNKIDYILPIYVELKGDDDFKRNILENYSLLNLEHINEFKKKYYERIFANKKRVNEFIKYTDNSEIIEYVFFCDGLDEITREEYDKFKVAINKIKSFSKHRCIISSRDIGFYAKDFSEFNLMCLLDFSSDKSKDFVEKYFQIMENNNSTELVDRKKQLINLIENNETIGKLSKSPILLSLLCVTRNLKEIKNKADLFKGAIKILLKNREITDEQEQEQFINFFKEIAVIFFKLDKEECFDASELEFYADKYFSKNGRNQYKDSYLSCGLFESSTKDNSFKFSHRTIWEYLVARGLVGSDKNLIYCRANMETWEEPIKMYVTLIPENEQKDFFEQLWKRNKSLTLRCMAELEEFPTDVFNHLYGNLKQKDKLSLVSALRESYEKPITDYRKQIVDTIVETLELMHIAEFKEKDCEVIYSYLSFLEEYQDEEATFKKAIYKFLDLDNLFERKQKFKNDYGLRFSYIDAGKFEMGRSALSEMFTITDKNGNIIDDTIKTDSEEMPKHKVRISKGFYLSSTLITNEMYYLSDFPYADLERYNNNPYSNLDKQPVNKISWYEAMIFAKWLGCSLPTEAEWEFALIGKNVDRKRLCKARLSELDDELKKIACYSENSQNRTRTVIPINPDYLNSNGLQDMLGNLREWCIDWYDENYYKKCCCDYYDNFSEDIKGKSTITYDDDGKIVSPTRHDGECYTFDDSGYCIDPMRRTPWKYETKCLRGGCFDWNKTNLRPTYRNHNPANNVYKVNGFRLVYYK